ncbi:MAG TPA: hypothetical protein PLU71_01480 [Candidatus Dependentiae bacterium]|nr:hypothetical protein [Candidatus Dependentiae bacterium]HRQ62503.1 hypothetical protein [Candidatus Dependentiae bacterium]
MKVVQKFSAFFLISIITTSSSFSMDLSNSANLREHDESSSAPTQRPHDWHEYVAKTTSNSANSALDDAPADRVDSNTQANDHAQEQAFHERLMYTKPEWFQQGTQSYYKKIDPIISRPNMGIDEWYPSSISIDGHKVIPNANGRYVYQGISFDLNSRTNFNPNAPLTIAVIHDNKSVKVSFSRFAENKVPALIHFDSYNALLNAARNNKISLVHKILFKGIIRVPGGKPHAILIEMEHGLQKPIMLQGIQFVYNKDEAITRIFFDFLDTAQMPVDFIDPIECRHTSVVADSMVFCIKDHKMYECTGKTIYNFFDSTEVRKKWAPQESGFYDQNNRCLTTLPSCYGNSDNHQETLKDPVAWVLGEGYDSFYQLHGADFRDKNDHVYCDDGVFYAMLPYKALCKEYFTQDPNNNVKFDYVVQVKKPHFIINKDVRVEGGHRDWPSGLYQRVRTKNRIYWQRVGNVATDTIKFWDKIILNTTFPSEPLTAPQINQWCNAAQRFFGRFDASIHHCDKVVLNGLKTWDKLTNLNLSRVELTNDVKWDELFSAIATMKQLTHLCFENNHPIANLFDGVYTTMADKARDYYINLAACLNKLTNLKELRIQKLWLKPHTQLGSGCSNESSVSTEVAKLTGIINHDGQTGVKSIIQSICALRQLTHLHIDGIPNHGSSQWARQTRAAKVVFFVAHLIESPLFYIDGNTQDAALKQLVKSVADQLAQMSSLKEISVYSPGGNCVDYFSKAFRERLAATRSAHTNLQPLTIKAEVLQ